MSEQILPGENFYKYVNNEWLNDPNNQIPSDYSSWGGFTKLYDDGLIKQINLVKDLENGANNEEEKKIYSIWKASEKRFELWNMPIIKECDYNPIKNELNILDNFYTQSDNYIDFLSKYLHYSQIHTKLFYLNNNKNVLYSYLANHTF